MVKDTNGGKLVVWKLAFRPPVVALNDQGNQHNVLMDPLNIKVTIFIDREAREIMHLVASVRLFV